MKVYDAARSMREEQLLASVLELARILGWTSAHFRPCKTAKGYRTAVQGDGAGFPDLILVHAKQQRLVAVELKSSLGVVSREQAAWLTVFQQAGAETHVWRPSDWMSNEIERVLRPQVRAEWAA